METALTVIYVLICVGLIASVLLQSGRSAGLSGSIAGGAQSLFGKKKGLDDMLSRVSTVLAVVFMLMAILLAVL